MCISNHVSFSCSKKAIIFWYVYPLDDMTGFMNEDDATANDRRLSNGPKLLGKHGTDVCRKESFDMVNKDSVPPDMPDCILKCKSVFKCRICPRIVCLNEESMKAHLNSKRHARSEKLLKENRLKAVLNNDGEIENQETPAEMHARVVALAQEKPSKKGKGRQRQRKRARKKKLEDSSEMEKGKSTKIPSKKRRKNEN
uniref:Uncharacterized protein MANES_01G113800 n=2 Tax=Rhizophora mucronata TaxID=61149 RepID=A0A2P2M5H4_RHIMU